MSEETQALEKHQAADHEFPEMEVVDGGGGKMLNFQDIMPISLKVTADLGKTAMKVKDILELKVGSSGRSLSVPVPHRTIYPNIFYCFRHYRNYWSGVLEVEFLIFRAGSAQDSRHVFEQPSHCSPCWVTNFL